MVLFATSPTLDMMRQCIARFYCRDNVADVQIDGEIVTLSGRPMVGVRVVKVGKRYRFESVV